MMFQFGLLPAINRPTRVTNKAIPAIDHIITNFVFNDFKTAIRTDIYDHFPITFSFKRGRSSIQKITRKIDIYINL